MYPWGVYYFSPLCISWGGRGGGLLFPMFINETDLLYVMNIDSSVVMKLIYFYIYISLFLYCLEHDFICPSNWTNINNNNNAIYGRWSCLFFMTDLDLKKKSVMLIAGIKLWKNKVYACHPVAGPEANKYPLRCPQGRTVASKYGNSNSSWGHVPKVLISLTRHKKTVLADTFKKIKVFFPKVKG